jgi:hypothetical protein
VSCDHKVGEDNGVGGTHGVGEEADVEGGSQQICVAEVTCVVWPRAVLLNGGCFDTRRLLTDSRRTCGTSTFDETTRLLEAAVRAWVSVGGFGLVCA